MKLATLLRRSGTADEFAENDETTALRREWDHLRASAESEAERTEIDAFFSRVMP